MLLCFFLFYLFTSGAFTKENSTYPQLFLYNIKYTSTALDNAYQSENKLIEPVTFHTNTVTCIINTYMYKLSCTNIYLLNKL